MVLLTSCGIINDLVPTARESANAKVHDAGFRLELAGGVEVTAPSGVAPPGTRVTAKVIDPRIPQSHSFVTAIGPAVDIQLAGGTRPETPITIDFPIPENIAIDPNRLFVLGESADPDRAADFVESSWNASTRTITATTDHLSWYAVTTVEPEELTVQFTRWVAESFSGNRTSKPDCVDAPTTSGAYVLADPWPTAAWVCATERAGRVTLTLESNSGLVFVISTDPEGTFDHLAATSTAGIATALVAMRMQDADLLNGDGVLLAGESTSITYDAPYEPVQLRLTAAPGLSQVAVLSMGVSMLLPEKWASALNWGECGFDGLGSLSGRSNGAVDAVLSCLAAPDNTASQLLGLLTTGPQLIGAELDGIRREVQGTNVERFTVYLVADDARSSLPQGARWLFDVPSRGTSTSGDEEIATLSSGASYPFSTNQWVGCDVIAETRFALNGRWSQLDIGLALQSHTPSWLSAQFAIAADGRPIYSTTITPSAMSPRQQLDVRGVEELTVTATTSSECTSASKGYGTLVQAFVMP